MRGTLTTSVAQGTVRSDRPAPPLLLSPRQLEPPEFLVIAALYFPYLELMHALAIGQRESLLWTSAWNWNPPVEDSRGLMQLNTLAWLQAAQWNLWDPQVNLYWAGDIFRREGWEPWRAAGPHPFPWV